MRQEVGELLHDWSSLEAIKVRRTARETLRKYGVGGCASGPLNSDFYGIIGTCALTVLDGFTFQIKRGDINVDRGAMNVKGLQIPVLLFAGSIVMTSNTLKS
jgi:hypothetical protein